jgi:putative Holliday junction resolvase
MARILAVDWGERRIGLAISDPLGVIATGLETLDVQSQTEAARRIAEIAAMRDVGRARRGRRGRHGAGGRA